jgi:hypothetical protein
MVSTAQSKEKSFAERIVAYMETQKYKIFRDKGEKNIVYVEGADTNGRTNDDRPNYFNDLRLIIAFDQAFRPVIEGIYIASTEPGFYYTDNPMNPAGAARIKFGQYTAWQVGLHGHSSPHEALVQVEEVAVHRDYNRDMMRTGDAIDWGLFGINQHWAYNYPIEDISDAGAGCLIGRLWEEHLDFMRRVKSDRRYIANRNFVFPTTIIDRTKLPE